MLKWISFILLLAIPAIAGAQVNNYSQMNMPVEIRAVWIDAGAIPKTEAGVRQLVRSYARANINLLFPETIMRGYAMYPSKLIARDPRFAGAPDVLAVMIDEAHRHHMEVHPWVWVFRAGYSKDKGAILTAHPDWAERGINGEDLSPNGGYWISPAVPAARDFLANLYAELLSCYNVDGIHLDYIRYEVDNKIPYGYSDSSKALFERQYGVNPEGIERLSIHKYEWNKFRERQVNTFVQRIALQTRRIKPYAMVSAAVGPEPDASRLELMQNWANWVANGWVDFLTPMAYSTDDPYFKKIVTQQEKAVCGKGLIAPGIGTFAQKTFEQSIRQIGMARQLGANGQAFFAASYLHEPQLAALAKESYSKPAMLPFRNPAAACESLSKYAVSAKAKNCNELADIYSAHAFALNDYINYRKSCMEYIAPTPPPLNTPPFVLPLPEAKVPEASSPINIDGILDDAAWGTAVKLPLIYDNLGNPAPCETMALITRNAQNLYIAFECKEPQISALRASVTKRDGAVFSDDAIEVFIDPVGDRKNYYHLAVNTLGTQFDEQASNAAWNGNWQAKAKAADGMWVAELAIPFQMLNTSTAGGVKLRINLTRTRMVTGKPQYGSWAVPYGSFHSPDRFGVIVFK